MKKIATLSAILLGAALSAQSWGHHGYPQYNLGQRVPMQGTIITYRLGNPHSHMTLRVMNEAGEEEIWAVETTWTLRGMRDRGFTPNMLQAGDEVNLMVSPALNGDRTAVFQSIEFEDGRILPPPDNN